MPGVPVPIIDEIDSIRLEAVAKKIAASYAGNSNYVWIRFSCDGQASVVQEEELLHHLMNCENEVG